MTNKEAIEILNPLFLQCKGLNGCMGYIEHFFTKNEEEALDLAIKALRIIEIIEDTYFDRDSNLMMDFDDWKDIKGFIEKGKEE